MGIRNGNFLNGNIILTGLICGRKVRDIDPFRGRCSSRPMRRRVQAVRVGQEFTGSVLVEIRS